MSSIYVKSFFDLPKIAKYFELELFFFCFFSFGLVTRDLACYAESLRKIDLEILLRKTDLEDLT
jgi:hypothetical protein